MNEETKLANDASQDEDKSFRAGLYIGGFSVAALLGGLFLTLLYSHGAHCHPTPTRVQAAELESGSLPRSKTARLFAAKGTFTVSTVWKTARSFVFSTTRSPITGTKRTLFASTKF